MYIEVLEFFRFNKMGDFLKFVVRVLLFECCILEKNSWREVVFFYIELKGWLFKVFFFQYVFVNFYRDFYSFGDSRDIRRDRFLIRGSLRREFRDGRNGRDVRDSRDIRDFRDLRDRRDSRDIRDYRDSRSVREVRDLRDFRDFRDLRDFRDFRDYRDFVYDRYRDIRDFRDFLYRYVQRQFVCYFIRGFFQVYLDVFFENFT